MTKIYKTAKGQMIDMDKLKLTSEKVTSVGNMRTNARGDVLGVGNEVATGRNAVMDQVYAVQSAPAEGFSSKPLIAPVQEAAPTEPATTKTTKK